MNGIEGMKAERPARLVAERVKCSVSPLDRTLSRDDKLRVTQFIPAEQVRGVSGGSGPKEISWSPYIVSPRWRAVKKCQFLAVGTVVTVCLMALV